MTNIQELKAKLQAKLGKDIHVRSGDEMNWIDESKDELWIDGPDWWKKVTSLRGITPGFIYSFEGKPDSGKSTTGQYFLIEGQKKGWICILVDVERKFSYNRFDVMGGSSKDLIVIAEPTIESNFDTIEKQFRGIREIDKETPIVLVYDSIAVGASQAELEKEATDPQTMADKAKVLKRMLQRQLSLIQQNKIAFIAINQVYAKIGFMQHGMQASGGSGLEYAKALSVIFSKVTEIYKTKEKQKYKIGIESKVKCSKNHLQQGDMIAVEVDIEITALGMRLSTAAAKPKKDKKGKIGPAEVNDDEEETVEIEVEE